MPALNPISSRQAIITISELPNTFFMSAKGGKVGREKVKYNDGQKGIEKQFIGFTTLEALTLTKAFDPSADKVVISWFKTQSDNATPFSVAIQAVKSDLAGSAFTGSSQLIYHNCVLGDYDYPDWDRMSSSLAIITIEIIYNELPSYA